MKIEDLYDEIEENRREGIDTSEMTIHLSRASLRELKRNANFTRASVKDINIEKVAGIDVVVSTDEGIEVETTCHSCLSDKVYHDKKEKWMCPWCDDL